MSKKFVFVALMISAQDEDLVHRDPHGGPDARFWKF